MTDSREELTEEEREAYRLRRMEDRLRTVCVAPIVTDILADAFARVQERGEEVERVLFHPVDYADLLKTGKPQLVSWSLTKEETSRMLSTGKFPLALWGAEVVRTLDAKENVVQVWGPTICVTIDVCR